MVRVLTLSSAFSEPALPGPIYSEQAVSESISSELSSSESICGEKARSLSDSQRGQSRIENP